MASFQVDEDWMMIESPQDFSLVNLRNSEENLSDFKKLQAFAVSKSESPTCINDTFEYDWGVVEKVKVDYNSTLEDELSPLEIMMIALEKTLRDLPEYMRSRQA